MKYILCIETGTDTCSVALAAGDAGASGGGAADGARLVALRESHGERDHAARAAVYVREVLDEAGVAPGAISAVAVSRGPGSYTGLRIGVSLAKGLCYGLGVPLIGVGSLDSLCRVAMEDVEKNSFQAAGEREAGLADREPRAATLIPMIDARRMEVFCQVFDGRGEALTGPEALVIDEGSFAECRGGEVAIFGSGAEKCRSALPWARFLDVRPSARGMIGLAFRAFREGRHEDTAYFEPFYLKDFLIKTSTKKLF